MIFLRPANQMLLRRAAGRGAAAAVRPRNNVRVWPTTLTSLPSSGDDNFSTRTPTTRRGFAGAAANSDRPRPSPWANFEMAPPDPIIGLTEVCVMLYFYS